MGTLSGALSAFPIAINNNGQVAAYCYDPGTYAHRAFLWDDGTITELGHLPGGVSSKSYDINDSGQVVGYSEWSGGGGLPLGKWRDDRPWNDRSGD